jgi:hydrogenase maturation protein HypF
MARVQINVSGTVQGVGFRPYVYWLARDLSLKGYVTNTSGGVTIEVEGESTSSFVDRLKKEAPPLASITNVEVLPLEPHGYEDFRILDSSVEESFTLVSPDISICEDCLHEMRDPEDRRFGYPFINCTNCGPRYTITRDVPYDRPNTTMAEFTMCPECEREYNDPEDRRFHAQPNACPECGPQVQIKPDGLADPAEDPIKSAANLLVGGKIIAVKGLGGYHLACDAANAGAVRRLRERKRGNRKPFAIMTQDMGTVKEHCHVSEKEEELLASARRPIVLLVKKSDCTLPEEIAPGNGRLGFMLPYTPLHYLIFDNLPENTVLLMTSGNLSEEPIQADNNEAAEKLGQIADAFLSHNRDIFMRVDDSVIKVTDRARFLRRARGYVPEPISLSVGEGPDVLAVGADLKNTFSLMKGPYAILSQHIGDMENYESQRFFEETLANLKAVYKVDPVALAYDMHPGYFSTRWALSEGKKMLSPESGQAVQAVPVQHHHAHIASVIAEKGISGKVIGVALDGTGYGTDGMLWGGEFLIADSRDFKRAGHFTYVPLPGGEQAVKEPWRMAVSYIRSAVGKDDTPEWLERIGFMERYGKKPIEDLLKILEISDFSPLSSGAGRLFDAVSAMLGICDLNTFEGEAAMALETVALEEEDRTYPVDISFKAPMEVDFSFALMGIINDMLSGTGKDVIAAKFHNTVAEAVYRVVIKIAQLNVIDQVALSGGVFQNDFLLDRLAYTLKAAGLKVYTNELVPVNDGGISLGQACILRERLKEKVKEKKK